MTLTAAQDSAGVDGDQVVTGIQLPMASMFTVDVANVVIEAIKRSQDGQSIVVRLYEAFGNRMHATIHSAMPVADVVECDLLERPLAPESSPAHALWVASSVASHDEPEVDDQGWSCVFGPFEVRTFLVWFAT